MVAVLRQIAGDKVADRVKMKPDERIQAIVKIWPVRFKTERALKLGFVVDTGIEEIIRGHIQEQGLSVA